MTRGTVTIVGGGIIGLSCAWRLVRDGWRVTVVDGAPEAREASWAAAGMLAPHHEASGPGPLWELGIASLARWGDFVHELELQPTSVDLHLAGGLLPVLDENDATDVATQERFLRAHGIAVNWLDAAALRGVEPALSDACRGALVLPGGQVNPRLVCARLQDAITRAGGSVRYHTRVQALEPGQVVLAHGETIASEEIVLASGAWTPGLAALAGIDLPGEPVKGQMLRLRAPDGLLSRFVHCHHAYLVPRAGLGLVVGATMVTSGFDRSEDAAAIERLAHGARRLVPALHDAPIVEHWTGLRPRIAHGLPVIARVRPGLIIATGHFRNGVLLAPITADLVGCLAANQLPPCDLRPFSCPRPNTP
jgi:glycine oxidase